MLICLLIYGSKMISNHSLFSNVSIPCLQTPAIVDQTKIDPPIRLLDQIIANGIVDENANLNANWHFLAEEFREEFNQRLRTFLDRKREINIRGLDLSFELAWQEVIDCIARVDPSVRVEILKKNALYFLGFKALDRIYKAWGVDLEKTCGPEYVRQLQQEIDAEPVYELIHFFVSTLDPVQIAQLKREILNLIATKLPIDTESPSYEGLETRIRSILKQKKDGQYKHWVDSFGELRLFIHNIVADALVAFKQIEPKNIPAPMSSLCLESDQGQVIEFEISSYIPLHKQSFSKDALHFPATFLSAEEMHHDAYYLMQAAVDIPCRVNTPLLNKPFPFIDTCSDILIQAIKGEVIPSAFIKNEVNLQTLQLAKGVCFRHPEQTLGKVLARYTSLALQKIRIEDPLKKYPCHAAIALTIAACENFAAFLSASEMNDLIQNMAVHWAAFSKGEDDGSPFYMIAKAMEMGVSYPLLSSFLQLSAYDNLHAEHPPEQIHALLTHRGSAKIDKLSKNQEQIIHLVQKLDDDHSIVLPLLNQPHLTVLTVLDRSVECQDHAPILKELLNRLQQTGSKNHEKLFEQTWIPDLEKSLPQLLNHLISHLEQTLSPIERLLYFKQFFQILRSKNGILSESEDAQIEDLLNALSKRKIKTAKRFYTPFLQLFGTFKNPLLNQAAYGIFKKSHEPSIEFAKAFCRGNIPTAINAYILVSQHIKKREDRYALFEILLSNLKNSSPLEVPISLDLLAREIDRLLEHPLPFDSAEWLVKQLLLSKRPNLAQKASMCIGNPDVRSVSQNAIERYLIEASAAYQSKESIVKEVEALAEANNCFTLINFLHESKVQASFKETPDEFWKLILIPSLKKFSEAPLVISSPLYACFFNLMLLFHPSPEDLQIFVSTLNRAIQHHSLEKPFSDAFLKTFTDSQLLIFSELPNDDVVWDLAHLALLYRLPLEPAALKVLLKKMNTYLEGTPNTRNVKIIYELLADSVLKKLLETSDKSLFSEANKKVSQCLINSHFAHSLAAFRQHYRLAESPDFNLCIAQIEACTTRSHLQEFCRLTSMLCKKKNENLINSWQAAFEKIFIGDETKKFDESHVKALAAIAPLPYFSAMLSQKLTIDLLDRLASFNPLSPQFVASLDCILGLLSNRTVPSSYYLTFFDKLSTIYRRELLDRAWIVLKTSTTLSKEEKSLCFTKLLPKMNFMEAAKAADFFNCSHQYIGAQTPLTIYVSLFENLEKVIASDKNQAQQTLACLEKLYRDLVQSPSFKPWSEEKERIHLAFAACISSLTHERKKREARDILYKVLKDKFSDKKAVWDIKLVKSVNSILRNISLAGKENEMTNLILRLPLNHEVTRHLMQKLIQEGKGRNRIYIVKLLQQLIKNSDQLQPKEYGKFYEFCSRLNLKNFLAEMTLLCDLPENELLLNFTSIKNILRFLSQRDIDDLCMDSYLNICRSSLQKKEFNPKFIATLLQKLPALVKNCKEEKIEEFTQILFPLIHQRFEKEKSVKEYINYFDLLNKALGMASAVDHAKKKGENSTYRLNAHFFRFAQSMIDHFLKNSDNHWLEIIYFLTDLLSKCHEDTLFKGKEKFDTIAYFSLILTYLKIRQNATSIETEKVNHLHEATVRFLEQHYKEKEYHPVIEGLISLNESQESQQKVQFSAHVHGSTRGSNEKVELINKILKGEPSELTLRLCLDLTKLNIVELTRNFNILVSLLEKLSTYIDSLNSDYHFDFLHRLSGIFYFIETTVKIEDIKALNRFKSVLKNHVNRFLNSMGNLDSGINSNFLFIISYPQIISMHKSFFKEQPQLLEICLNHLVTLCANFLIKHGVYSEVFENMNSTLQNLYSDHPFLCSEIMTRWIEKLSLIVTDIEEEKRPIIHEEAAKAIKFAFETGIFYLT